MARSFAKPTSKHLSRARLLGLRCALAVVVMVVLGGLVPGTGQGVIAEAAAATTSGTSYHVDCLGGDDAATGKSPAAAWRTLVRANEAHLGAGDALLLRRSCTWTGSLTLEGSGTPRLPIDVGPYGEGSLPKIQNAFVNVLFKGSYITVHDLIVRAAVTAVDPTCDNQPIGITYGFRFAPGSSHNTVQDSIATGLFAGARIDIGSSNNRILNSTFSDNVARSPDRGSDAGAVGIIVGGDNNEIAYNDISGSVACTRAAYRWDGSAVEVFGGKRNVIHHNRATNNQTFAELGDARSADNVFDYNYVTSDLPTSNFIVTRGSGGERGPVYGTLATNNIVKLTGVESLALQCIKGCNSRVLSLRRNIIWSEGSVGYADGSFDEGDNVYWRADGNPVIWFEASPSSKVEDPLLTISIAGAP